MTPQSAPAVQPVKVSVITKRSEPREVLNRVEQIRGLIQRRAFEIFDHGGRFFGRDWSDWFQAEAELLHPLHLEIEESKEALTVRAEVPGFTDKELDIHVEPRRVTIAGKHEHKREENKNHKTIYSETCAQEILRSVDLPSVVDPSKASATLKDGILSIEVPKVANAKGLRVEPRALN